MRLILAVFLFFVSCEGEEYYYASDVERMLCTLDVCPGEECLCILGMENTWYLNPTIGDLDEPENEYE